MQYNPYEWELKRKIDLESNNIYLRNIYQNYGKPTTDIIKKYIDLGNRISYELKKNKELTNELEQELELVFDANKPLHFHFNQLLKEPWEREINNYTGTKTNIPLYTLNRSKATQYLSSVSVDKKVVNLYEQLKSVTNKVPEFHHVLYKALYPQYATATSNLMLAGRSESEKREGPGQHELIHMVASGNHKNKFKVLLPQFKQRYSKWFNNNL